MTIAGGIFVALGVLLMALAAAGLLRLPDVYSRLNATTKAASLGIVCVLTGAALLMPGPGNAIKLGLAAAIQLATAPIGAYAIARAAYRAGVPMTRAMQFDDIARDGVELSATIMVGNEAADAATEHDEDSADEAPS